MWYTGYMEQEKKALTPANILMATGGQKEVITADFDPLKGVCDAVFAGRDLAPKTLKDRHLHLAVFFEWFKSAGYAMSPDVYVNWKQYLANDKRLTPSRKNSYLVSVKQLVYYLIRTGLLDRDITIGVPYFKFTREPRSSALKQRDVGRIFAYIRCIKDAYERATLDVLFCLLVYQALREGEIRGLRWEDVDMEDKRIRLRNTKKKTDEAPKIHTETEKALRKLKRFPGPGWNDAPVLLSKERKPIKTWRQTKRLMDVVLKPLLIEAKPHDFRAMAITRAAKESLILAQDLARHSAPSVTSGYIVGRKEALDEYMRRGKRRVVAKKRRKAVKKRGEKRKVGAKVRKRKVRK